MISSEEEFRVSIEWMARMYRQQEREAAEPLWDPATRAIMASQTETMRLKLECEVAEYLIQKYAASSQERKSEAGQAA